MERRLYTRHHNDSSHADQLWPIFIACRGNIIMRPGIRHISPCVFGVPMILPVPTNWGRFPQVVQGKSLCSWVYLWTVPCGKSLRWSAKRHNNSSCTNDWSRSPFDFRRQHLCGRSSRKSCGGQEKRYRSLKSLPAAQEIFRYPLTGQHAECIALYIALSAAETAFCHSSEKWRDDVQVLFTRLWF